MVDVGQKPVSQRRAVAVGHVVLQPRTIELLRAGDLQKGDALAVARIAGIAAAKRTPDLILLCLPIEISVVALVVDLVSHGVAFDAEVIATDCRGSVMAYYMSIASYV